MAVVPILHFATDLHPPGPVAHELQEQLPVLLGGPPLAFLVLALEPHVIHVALPALFAGAALFLEHDVHLISDGFPALDVSLVLEYP
jgi:hypothetical protein